MKPTFKFSIALTALCAFTLGWALSQQQPQVKAIPAIPAFQAMSTYIKSVPVEKGDIAKLLRINALKFEFALPDQHPYYAVLWVESWNRSALKPVLHQLAILTINGDHTLMLKLPKDNADEFVVATDNSTDAGHLPELTSLMNGGIETLGFHSLSFDKDIVLVAVAHDNLRAVKYEMLGIKKCNDQVRLIKLRFTKSDPHTPKWQNGHVVL